MKIASSKTLNITVGYANHDEWIKFCRERGGAREKKHIEQYRETRTKGVFAEGGYQFRRMLFLDDKSVIVPAFDVFYKRHRKADRLRWGEIIVHEIAHAQGADEYDAYVAGRDYLRKNGLMGPSNKQIFLTISEGDYSKEEKEKAEKKVYGSASSPLKRFARCLLVRLFEGRYMISRDKFAGRLKDSEPGPYEPADGDGELDSIVTVVKWFSYLFLAPDIPVSNF